MLAEAAANIGADVTGLELMAFEAEGSTWRCRGCSRLIRTENVAGRPVRPTTSCAEHVGAHRTTKTLPDLAPARRWY